jgi:UDP-N-acetylmuramoyl-tripeptide--D-alanyl-D-alanine ligase
MIGGTLRQWAPHAGGILVGDDGPWQGIALDSRMVQPGMLFAALPGRHADGHAFVADACARGAAAALVSHRGPYSCPCIVVEDVQTALGAMARRWRRGFSLPVVAVTGSSGKTTTRALLQAILEQRGPVLASTGNQNNELGVPITLSRLGQEHHAAVVELGARAPGDIAYLAEMTRPTVGVVLNAGPAHLETFGSVAGVARAKGELLAHLGPGAVAAYNADDRFAHLWRVLAGTHSQIPFGIESEAPVYPSRLVQRQGGEGSTFCLHVPTGSVMVHLPLPGLHNVYNALAAAAAATVMGCSPEEIAMGLAGVHPVAGRLVPYVLGRHMLLDDSYNANPASLEAAMRTACQWQPRAWWLCLGDMLELGDQSLEAHEQAGRLARSLGFVRCYALGRWAGDVVAAFGDGARRFTSSMALLQALCADLKESGEACGVLIKGSRAMGLDVVSKGLREWAMGHAS